MPPNGCLHTKQRRILHDARSSNLETAGHDVSNALTIPARDFFPRVFFHIAVRRWGAFHLNKKTAMLC